MSLTTQFLTSIFSEPSKVDVLDFYGGQSSNLGVFSLLLQVYTVAVSAFLGGSKPSRFGNVRGDVAISFSCDPDVAWKLVCPLINLIHGHGD
jgi:hypothetical protein